MYETEKELADLQALLDASLASSTGHLRDIVRAGRALTAPRVAAVLTGMRLLTAATVTARGEPRISALDGHFLHGTWTFSTAGKSAKAQHLRARPAVSVAHVPGEGLGVFAHGTAEQIDPAHPWWEETIAHWTAHYSKSPLEFGQDVRMYRLRPSWMVAWAMDPSGLTGQASPGPGADG